MNLKLNKQHLLIGLAIILLTNVVALSGVAYNRTGEPESRPILTERELQLPYRRPYNKDNSGIALRMKWRVFDKDKTVKYNYWANSPHWFNSDKLKALDFDVGYPLNKPDSSRHYRKMLSRDVYLVLEYNGDSYRQVLQHKREHIEKINRKEKQVVDKKEYQRRLKKAKKDLKEEQHGNSRLFVIDAGLDAEQLRQQYPNKQKFLIVRGQVEPLYLGQYNKTPRLGGHITRLSISHINIPLAHNQPLLPLIEQNTRRDNEQAPRYQVKLHYGKRLEPWVVGVERIK